MRLLVIALGFVIAGCSASDRMGACGRMCLYGAKAYDDSKLSCECVSIDDVCKAKAAK